MEVEAGGGGGVASTGGTGGYTMYGGGGEGHLLDGMVQEGGRCPNVEVQHLRKREYPDEVERGAL